jgi:hypothetical protein
MVVLCTSRSGAPIATFLHVPKAAGTSLGETLQELPVELFNCTVALGAVAVSVGWRTSRQLRLDAMHLTARELRHIAKRQTHFAGRLRLQLSHAGGSERYIRGEAARALLAAAASAPHVVAFVRSPYLRVLGAFRQRTDPEKSYDRTWGAAYPRQFEPFMEWLASGLRSGRLSWERSGGLVHFRPATLYTADATFVGKVEALRAGWRQLFLRLLPGHAVEWSGRRENARDARGNVVEAARADAALCTGPEGCRAVERAALLRLTPHTPRTIALTNELYARDFERLNYTRLL